MHDGSRTHVSAASIFRQSGAAFCLLNYVMMWGADGLPECTNLNYDMFDLNIRIRPCGMLGAAATPIC